MLAFGEFYSEQRLFLFSFGYFFTAEQLERFVSRSADPRACGNARERRADVKLSSSHAA